MPTQTAKVGIEVPTMPEVQQRLAKARSTISLTIRALSSLTVLASATSTASTTAAPSGAPPAAQFPGLLKDLLAALRHSTTSLALSFKPPITVPAALHQTDKLVNDLCQAASCVIAAAESDLGGGVLQDEWKDGMMDICAEVARFLDILSEAAVSSTSTSASQASASGSKPKKAEDDHPYLHHTALVWDAIDKLTSDLSASEADAVVKRWKADTAVVRDAWTEFKESIEDMGVGDREEQTSALEEGDELDEWDGGGLDADTMTEQESRDIEIIKPTLQLYQLLHAAIPRFIAAIPFSRSLSSRDLITASSGYTEAFDELVSALIPEHDADEIDAALEGMSSAADRVNEALRLKGIGKDGEAFLSKWEERMMAEEEKWQGRRMDLGDVASALDQSV